jgi:hypothetical protein
VRLRRDLLERARTGDAAALEALRGAVPRPRCPGELLAAPGATPRERDAAVAHARGCRTCG